jgi:hypothetical protein
MVMAKGAACVVKTHSINAEQHEPAAAAGPAQRLVTNPLREGVDKPGANPGECMKTFSVI